MNLADLRRQIPELEGLDDASAVDAIQQAYYPDIDRRQIADRLGVKLAAPAAPPPAKRSLWAVANDTVIEGANAAAGAVGSVADFISPGNRVSKFIDENIIRPGEASQSDVVQQSRKQFQDEVDAADGIGGELMAVGRKVLRDPLLTAAQAAGSFVIPGAAVKGGNAVAGALGAGARGVARGGLAGGAAAGAALSGGDAAGTAYDLVIKAGGSEEEAAAAARQASALPAAVGAAGGLVGAERLLAGAGGMKGGLMARALKTAGVEGAQEGFEEGITQYEGQRAAVPFDPSIDPMKGTAAAAGMGAVMGGAIGGATGLLSPHHPEIATKRLAEADNVSDMIGAAEDLAMAPLEPTPKPRAAGADAIAEIRMLDPEQQQEALGLLGTAGNMQAPGHVRRFAQNRLDELLQPLRQIPVGEVTEDEIIPAGEAQELSMSEANGQILQPPEPGQWLNPGQRIPRGEATEMEMPALDEPARKPRKIPAGEATELEVEQIQADDLLTGDDKPYGTRAGAAVRATREGLPPSSVVEVPGGYVVRKESKSEPVPDVDRVAPLPAGPADGTGADAGGSLGNAGPDAAGGGGRGGSPAASAGSGGPAVAVGAGGQPDAALSEDLPTLKKQWADAVRANDNALAKRINDRIVELKKNPEQRTAPPVAESQVPAAAGSGDAGVAPSQAGSAPELLALKDRVDAKRQPDAAAPAAQTAPLESRVPEAAAPDARAETAKNAEQRYADARRLGREASERGDPRDPPQAFTSLEKQTWRAGWDAGKATKRTPQVPVPAAASWVIREKDTGRVVMETFDRKKVEALNTSKYEAVPIREHLAGLNRKAEPAAVPHETPAAAETALPAAGSATTPAQPAADKPTIRESRTVDEPAKPKRAPKSFRKKIRVTTPVFVEETGAFESREIDADTALKALDEDVSELEKFLACLKG